MNDVKDIRPTTQEKTRKKAVKFGVESNEGFLKPIPLQHNNCPHENQLTDVLLKGKYDIHYVISLIKIILQKKPHFGLQQSLMRLLAMLEVERDNSTNFIRKN